MKDAFFFELGRFLTPYISSQLTQILQGTITTTSQVASGLVPMILNRTSRIRWDMDEAFPGGYLDDHPT